MPQKRRKQKNKNAAVKRRRSNERKSVVPSATHPARLLDAARGLRPVFATKLGQLFQGDCLHLLKAMSAESVDMVFADPPFNLGKEYGKGISDERMGDEYLLWSESWLRESVRVLRPGGSIFVFNLPRWLINYGSVLDAAGMEFRHWIAMRMPKAFPRGKRLSPAHYGCLYYTKGEPTTFNKVYTPIQTCRHCHREIRDYGGHRKALNERGINLMDVIDAPNDVWTDAPDALVGARSWTELDDLWEDIPPVRHSKYKTRGANELAPLMLERLIGVATNKGDLVLDPFGGSGTTFYAAERLERRWIGTELGDTSAAVRRLTDLRKGKDVRWEKSRGFSTPTSPQQLGLLDSTP